MTLNGNRMKKGEAQMKHDIQATWDRFAKSGRVGDYLIYHSHVVETLQSVQEKMNEEYCSNSADHSAANGIRKG